MNLLWFLIPVFTFQIGVFAGFWLMRNKDRARYRRVWERVERRNIMRTISTLVSAIDFKDHLTKSHSDNVRHYACAIARAMNLPAAEIESLKDACHLHDLGKIGVHDHILTKPDVLTDAEQREMRLHSLAGAVMIKPFRFLQHVGDTIRQHHERFDGKGYPDGLSGEKISLGARIMAVADSFDAMTSQRYYRKPLTCAEAMEELRRHAGTQFDPHIVDVFIQLLNENPALFTPVRETPYGENHPQIGT